MEISTLCIYQGPWKKGIGSLFDSCVNAMGQRPYYPSWRLYRHCTFGYGMIICHNLPNIVTMWITVWLPTCAWLSPGWKGNTPFLTGLAMKKIRRYNNTPPYVTARWPPQQIPALNILGYLPAELMLLVPVLSPPDVSPAGSSDPAASQPLLLSLLYLPWRCSAPLSVFLQAAVDPLPLLHEAEPKKMNRHKTMRVFNTIIDKDVTSCNFSYSPVITSVSSL